MTMTKNHELLDKNFIRNALLFVGGLCAASCAAWEAMGAVL